VLYAVAAASILSSARAALTVPAVVPARPVVVAPDLGVRAFAALFARRYLSWDASRPDDHRRGLEPFVGAALDPDLGLRVPASGRRSVSWTEVIDDWVGGGGRLVTVCAQTLPEGLVYLSVPVRRDSQGRLALAGYPALVGPPSTVALRADPDQSLPEVSDPELESVASRALSNFLAGSQANLAADLAPGAHPSGPRAPMTVQRSVALRWSADGRSLVAVVEATDTRGTSYTLRYLIAVVRAQARWEIAAIQTDPTA